MRVPKGFFRFVRRHAPTPAAVASVTVVPATLTVAVGSSAPLSATVVDTDGTVLTGRTLSWASSDEAVASVDSATGQVSGISSGSAVVTATDVASGVESTVGAAITVSASSSGRTGKLLFLQSAGVSGGLGAMNAQEKALKEDLEALGWAVDVGKIAGTGQFALTDYRAAILAPSCGYNSNWASSWKTAAIPVLCLSTPAILPLGLAAQQVSLGTIDTVERSLLVLPGVDETPPGAFDLFTSDNKLSLSGWSLRSQDAQVWYHALGDHFTTVFAVYDRGEMLSNGSTAAARRAFGAFGFKADVGKWSTTGARQIVYNALDWLVEDPGDAIVPRFSYSRSYSPDASALSATGASTVPAGRTIASRSWVLRDVTATSDLAVSSGSAFSSSPLADGAYHLDLTIVDNLGNSRTKRQLVRTELVTPVAGFTFTRSDGSPDHNHIDTTLTALDRGVDITDVRYDVYSDSSLTTLVYTASSEPAEGGGLVLPLGPLANGTYYVTQTVTNADGQTDTTAPKVISVPTPAILNYPWGSGRPAEIHAVGDEAFAYALVTALSGCTIDSCTWAIDLSSVGAGTMTFGGDLATHSDALHPGRGVIGAMPVFPAAALDAGPFPWTCDVVQSNGWTGHYEGVTRPWTPPSWATVEDYTTPADPGTTSDLYCDADAASDGVGTSTDPCKLLSTLEGKIAVGKKVHLAGDFTSQGAGLYLDNLGGGTASLGTIIQQWEGKAPAILYSDTTNLIDVRGGSYVRVRGLDLRLGYKVNFTCTYFRGGSHNSVLSCKMQGGQKGVWMDISSDWWVQGCDIHDIGHNVTLANQGNGGYDIAIGFGSHRGTAVYNLLGNAGHNAMEALVTTSGSGLWSADEREYPNQTKLSRYCRWAFNYVQNTYTGSYGPAGAEGTLLEHNIIIDTGTATLGSGTKVGSRGTNLRNDLNTFRFNRVIRTRWGALQCQDNLFNSVRVPYRRNRHYHNTYAHCGLDSSGTVIGSQSCDSYHLTTGVTTNLGTPEGLFYEGNLWENECHYENVGRYNNAPKTYQIFLLHHTTPWTEREIWQNTSRLGIGADAAGNVVRNCVFKRRDAEVSSGGGQFMHEAIDLYGWRTYDTPDAVADVFPAWTGNQFATPVFVSTADPGDWANDTSFAPDSSSPTYDGGVAVAGLDYSALGGRVPIGWDPGFGL